MNREKVGKVAHDLMLKEEKPVKVEDLQKAMQEDYMKNLLEQVDLGFTKYPQDFFIVVITKKEKLMENVLRNYFFVRQSCPTPDYDQSVYRYKREGGIIEYLWTVPSKDACMMYLENASNIVYDEKALLGFVINFANGNLFELAKKFNGEEKDSSKLEH